MKQGEIEINGEFDGRLQRVAVDVAASYSVDEKLFKRAQLRELSRSGLRLLTLQPLPIGASLKVMFDSGLLSPTHPPKTIDVNGRVGRLIRQSGPRYDYAVDVLGDDDSNSALQQTVMLLSKRSPNSSHIVYGDHHQLAAPEEPSDRRPLEERRSFIRVAVDLEATHRIPGHQAISSGRITEISRTGVRLRTHQSLASQSFVEITFAPPGHNGRVCVRGKVARLAHTDDFFEYGITVLSGSDVERALQRAVLQAGLKAASKRADMQGSALIRVR